MIFAGFGKHATMDSLFDKWFLILNPEAGGGKGRKLLPEIESALRQASLSYSLHITQSAGEAVSAVKSAIKKGYRKMIAVGGDGTFNETINGIIQQQIIPGAEITLALIPAGTGNDWPRTWQIPSDPLKAIQLIVRGNTTLHPAGLIKYHHGGIERQTWFVNVAGCGFDAEVAEAANKAKMQGKSGLLTYISQLAKTLFRFREAPAKVTINGEIIHLSLFAVLAGIGRYAGNGMKLVPGADPHSGQFSIALVRKINRIKIISNLHRLFTGSFTRLREVQQMRSDTLEVSSSQKLLLQADGESIGEAPVHMQIFANKIRLVVPS
jgi:YegS/Rv2252/BmrU family lipid kinase